MLIALKIPGVPADFQNHVLQAGAVSEDSVGTLIVGQIWRWQVIKGKLHQPKLFTHSAKVTTAENRKKQHIPSHAQTRLSNNQKNKVTIPMCQWLSIVTRDK